MQKEYIWQTVQKEGLKNASFRKEIEYPSLTEEVAGRDRNRKARVNLRLRFPFLLGYTAKTEDENKEADEEKESSSVMPEWELDLFMHFAAIIDLYSGYNGNIRQLNQIHKNILDGLYGEKAKDLFCTLLAHEQEVVLRNLCIHSMPDGLAVFRRAYKELYPSGLIYRNGNNIIVYLDREETEKDKICLEVLRIFFLQMTYRLKVHFKYHVGIIGVEETMQIGKIRVI